MTSRPRTAFQFVPWSAWMLACGLTVAGAFLAGDRLPTTGDVWVNVGLGVGYPLAGAVILTYRPRHGVGRLLIAIGLASAGTLAIPEYATRAIVVTPGSLPFGVGAAWIASWWWALGAIPALTLLPLLFPDGRLPSRRWWPAAAVAVAAVAFNVLAGAFAPGALLDFPSVPNPLGIAPLRGVLAVLRGAAFPLFLAAILASAGSIVVRWRRADTVLRRQLGWFVSATLAMIAVVILDSAGVLPRPLGAGLACLGAVLVAVAIVAAVLRHRLYGIDLVVNRTLVYSALTAGSLAAYLGVVAIAGRIAGRLTGSLIAAGVVAVAFQPIRNRVQRAVDRMLYGDRSAPAEAVARLASRLAAVTSPSAVLPTAAEAVAEALRARAVRIEVHRDGKAVASASSGEVTGDVDKIALRYHDQAIGHLLVARTGPADELSGWERRLLDDLLWHVGAAVHVVLVTIDLQRSREQAIAAREEERRRMRRDLHDGLGPALAGLALGLEGAQQTVPEDSPAGALLAQLTSDAYATIDDVRRLVYQLRPAALDELGLVGALRERASSFVSGSGTPHITVESPGGMPMLPAAVEVAAYRIAVEAMTNVTRHARAVVCTVGLRAGERLEIVVEDDGVGIGWASSGVGLASMRERAAELGGTLDVLQREPHGTRVVARLPMDPR